VGQKLKSPSQHIEGRPLYSYLHVPRSLYNAGDDYLGVMDDKRGIGSENEVSSPVPCRRLL
jgi:hypothetical protein